MVAQAVWKILIFCLYHARPLSPDRTPPIDQTWVVLRNSNSALEAAKDLLKPYLPLGDRSRRGEPSLLLKVALPTLAVILFKVGGIALPPLIATGSPNGTIVLSEAGTCGFKIPGLTSFEGFDVKGVAAVNARDLADTTAGRNYAAERYGNATSALSTKPLFPSEVLPFTVNRSALCPFSDEMCLLGPSAAISFDTGLLDSHSHLGINARPGQRVQYRWKSTCSPLSLEQSMVERVSNMTIDGHLFTEDDGLFRIFLGKNRGNPYTISWQLHLHDPTGYQVQTTSATQGFASELAWDAIPALNRTDADVSLIFIAPNFIQYSEQVFDPVFQANGTKQEPLQGPLDGNQWLSDFTFRSIACAEQHQYCDPNTGSCTALNGTLGDFSKPFTHSGISTQFATAHRLNMYAFDHYIENSVKSLGSNALIAHSLVPAHALLSPGLPEDQWQLETQRWFETGLAKFQFKATEFPNVVFSADDAIGFRPSLAQNVTPSPQLNTAISAQCGSQRVQSTGQVQNFSVLGMAVLLACTAIICGLAVSIEWLGRIWSREEKTALWEGDELLALWLLAAKSRSGPLQSPASP